MSRGVKGCKVGGVESCWQCVQVPVEVVLVAGDRDCEDDLRDLRNEGEIIRLLLVVEGVQNESGALGERERGIEE